MLDFYFHVASLGLTEEWVQEVKSACSAVEDVVSAYRLRYVGLNALNNWLLYLSLFFVELVLAIFEEVNILVNKSPEVGFSIGAVQEQLDQLILEGQLGPIAFQAVDDLVEMRI